MKYNRLSFFSVLIALGVMPSVSNAGIRVGNLSRNNAQGYQQVNEQRYQQAVIESQAVVQELPIQVTNPQLAQQIQSGDKNSSVTMEHLNKCKMIYPNGEFEWAVPTIGKGAGGAPTCTSVVELRVIGQAQNGGDTVLARANLAAGDSFNCNISNFPDSTRTTAAGEIIFPADKEPSVEDVIEVMNEEQKQNAALKIIGGAVLFGLGGNAIGKNDAGKDGVFGANKDKMVSTAIAAAGGAGLMAASAYSGKVAGDMILSTGVNAAAGAVVGNIITGGDDVMRIENCIVDGVAQKCIWGYIEEKGDVLDDAYVNINRSTTFVTCANDKCRYADLTGGTANIGCEVPTDAKKAAVSLAQHLYSCRDGITDTEKYCYKNGKMENFSNVEACDEVYVKLSGASEVTNRTPAMLAIGKKEPGFGIKCDKKNISDSANGHQDFSSNKIVGMSGKGEQINLSSMSEKTNLFDLFQPSCRGTEDGGIIDMDNKARLKGTLTGAGIGGAAGAFTAYQGAQQEIQERWVTAVREYKDSLQKFYCGTGNRYMSFYNDAVIVPMMGTVQ